MNRIRISFSHNILFKKATSKIVHSCFHRWQRLRSDTRRFWQRSSKNCFNLCVASRLSYGRVKTVLYHILLQSPPWTAYTPLSFRYAFTCFFLQKVMAFHKGNLIHFQNQKSVLQPVFRNIKKFFFSILNIWFPVNIIFSKFLWYLNSKMVIFDSTSLLKIRYPKGSYFFKIIFLNKFGTHLNREF